MVSPATVIARRDPRQPRDALVVIEANAEVM
jgi:hypothetical protein